MSNTSRTSSRPRPDGRPSRQRTVIMAGLLGMLTLVSIMFLVFAPAPLKLTSLLAVEPLDRIFRTEVAIDDARWKSLYIHHSKTVSGDATTLPTDAGGLDDHFIIGNGDGADDGEILISPRWLTQAAAMPNGRKFDADCICICLVGDLDGAAPTTAQVHRLGELVRTLQSRFHIPATKILIQDIQDSPAGLGQRFPRTAFAQDVLH
ncbi:MAG: N-acetylmuramoyl-L-alanine amidase [Tepidisphaerales bacterium]